MSEDLFSNNDTPPATQAIFENEGTRNIVIDQAKDWLGEYVGEGKKFKDVADLAKGKAHSDAFIARLEKEMEGLRTELNTRLKLEEFMDRMNSNNSSQAASQTTQTAGSSNQFEGTAQNTISPTDIEKVIEQRLQAREAEKAVQTNLEMTKSKLQAAFGENYVSELEARTQSLGLSKDFVNDLAKREPKALFALLNLNETPQRQAPDVFAPRGSVNTGGLSQASSQEKTFKDYEKLRKENPAVYWSSQVQNEIHRQAEKLGERFYS